MKKILMKIRKAIGFVFMLIGAPATLISFCGYFVLSIIFGPGIEGAVGAPGEYPLSNGSAPVSADFVMLLFVVAWVALLLTALGAWLYNLSLFSDSDIETT